MTLLTVVNSVFVSPGERESEDCILLLSMDFLTSCSSGSALRSNSGLFFGPESPSPVLYFGGSYPLPDPRQIRDRSAVDPVDTKRAGIRAAGGRFLGFGIVLTLLTRYDIITESTIPDRKKEGGLFYATGPDLSVHL